MSIIPHKATVICFETRSFPNFWKTNPEAKKYDEVSIDEVIAKNLQVVDMTASILCRDNKMPMLVFGLNEENSIVNAANGKINGTRVTV